MNPARFTLVRAVLPTDWHRFAQSRGIGVACLTFRVTPRIGFFVCENLWVDSVHGNVNGRISLQQPLSEFAEEKGYRERSR
jgi:hypothetical protein